MAIGMILYKFQLKYDKTRDLLHARDSDRLGASFPSSRPSFLHYL